MSVGRIYKEWGVSRLNRKLLFRLLATVLTVGVLAGCGAPKLDEKAPAQPSQNQETASKEPVKIGLTISLSGGTADMGQAAKDGAELAIKEINDKGGVLGGRKLQLISYDDETKAEKGLENVKRLIEQERWSPSSARPTPVSPSPRSTMSSKPRC